MTEAVKNELDRIVSTLVKTGIVTKIILFGSHAQGKATPDSDIDLCVLTSDKDRHPIDLIVDFRTKLYEIRTMPLDLLAYNQDNFYNSAKRPTSFEHEIAENGVSIYDYR
ncbi:MAG: nucleotidyltransferase domain-containing protein [Chitinispirillales bacterium]|jgi:predicted nucleotidyltransferase|nr:nucleotidyltransferase domain-containing protein [Chitinispirillales bacterium]